MNHASKEAQKHVDQTFRPKTKNQEWHNFINETSFCYCFPFTSKKIRYFVCFVLGHVNMEKSNRDKMVHYKIFLQFYKRNFKSSELDNKTEKVALNPLLTPSPFEESHIGSIV